VQVKRNRAELAADPTTPHLAGIIEGQPGWRYDLVILEGTPEVSPGHPEPSPDQIGSMLKEAEKVVGVSTGAAFLMAWAGLEASMRRLAQRAGIGGRPGTQTLTLIRELYSSGQISSPIFRHLEELRLKRTEIAHGLEPPAVDPEWVRSLVELARKFLAD